MKRTVVKIDEILCNGCGLCVDGCHEGALQLIDGKARIINETFCDGLGACIGECPVGAIQTEEKEAESYDEYAVMEKLVSKGEKTIKAHLLHLKEHNEIVYVKQGLQYLEEHNIKIDTQAIKNAGGCPGSMAVSFKRSDNSDNEIGSQLSHWPIQLHLLNPQASYFKDADMILAADCSSYAFGNFHNRFLKNHTLAIACPKLDSDKEEYVEKITTMVDIANINTLMVVIMEVPCCGGLLQLAQQAVKNAKRKIPIKKIVVGIKGDILKEEWI
ncbi:MAG: 4Fe-4S binding protein [Treponema sp.]|jgi:NAD-dependent dihydropyrimidine dehydrogenase PreA subunit|nr:4Fe-4S binding protein [Treponema sp.]